MNDKKSPGADAKIKHSTSLSIKGIDMSFEADIPGEMNIVRKLFYFRRPVRLASWSFALGLTLFVIVVVAGVLRIVWELHGLWDLTKPATYYAVAFYPVVIWLPLSVYVITLFSLVVLLLGLYKYLCDYIVASGRLTKDILDKKLEKEFETRKFIAEKALGAQPSTQGKEGKNEELEYKITIAKERTSKRGE